MALTRTTLSGAVTADADRVVLASISTLAVGDVVLVDNEKMGVLSVPSAATLPVVVRRGIGGTKAAAHVASAGAVFGLPGDHSVAVRSEPRGRDVASYSASGAIALPTPGRDKVAILNGTDALAMTIANPGKDNDGDILIVVGNGKAAHTVEATGDYGDGGSGYDVLTFQGDARNTAMFIAANERWNLLPSLIGGTATNVTATIT